MLKWDLVNKYKHYTYSKKERKSIIFQNIKFCKLITQIGHLNISQGMIDGSAAKPALRQDTGFWGLFNASVTQIWFKRCFNIQRQLLECGSQLTLSSIWSEKILFLLNNDPNRQYGGEKLPFISIFRPFWGLFHAPGTQIGFKIGSHISK